MPLNDLVVMGVEGGMNDDDNADDGARQWTEVQCMMYGWCTIGTEAVEELHTIDEDRIDIDIIVAAAITPTMTSKQDGDGDRVATGFIVIIASGWWWGQGEDGAAIAPLQGARMMTRRVVPLALTITMTIRPKSCHMSNISFSLMDQVQVVSLSIGHDHSLAWLMKEGGCWTWPEAILLKFYSVLFFIYRWALRKLKSSMNEKGNGMVNVTCAQ